MVNTNLHKNIKKKKRKSEKVKFNRPDENAEYCGSKNSEYSLSNRMVREINKEQIKLDESENPDNEQD